MRIVCISDTHDVEGLRQLSIPDGDVLVHAGDLTGRGSWRECAKALAWLGALPHRHKILIAGNHDFWFEEQGEDLSAVHAACHPSVRYLQDSGCTIDGVRFWGSPWQPWFHDWAFNLQRGVPLRRKWDLIPEDTQVLITHGPPFGILDSIPESYRQRPSNVGCEDLLHRTNQLPALRLHVFGHIHYSYGSESHGGRTFVNACICDEQYRAANAPIVVDL